MENKKIDKIIEAFRNYINLKEDGVISGPTNNVGSGNIAGTPQTDHGNPPVDLRRRKEKRITYSTDEKKDMHGLKNELRKKVIVECDKALPITRSTS